MASTDTKAAQEAGVAVPTTSKDDYLKKVADVPTNLGSSDQRDPSVGWTTQSGSGFFEPDSVPGQVYLPHQLPDPAQAVAAGLPPVQVPEHLITDDTDHPQGPEPSELVIADSRVAIQKQVVAQAVDAVKVAKDAQAANVSDDVVPATDPSGQTIAAQSSGGPNANPGVGSGSSSSSSSNADSGSPKS